MNKLILISVLLLFLPGCFSWLPELPSFSVPTLYKNDILQGSVLDKSSVNQLKLGMSTAQVQSLIGSPSIIDPFHNNQWDYVNYSTLHKQDDIHYRLTLRFTDGLLSYINTDVLNSLSKTTKKRINNP